MSSLCWQFKPQGGGDDDWKWAVQIQNHLHVFLHRHPKQRDAYEHWSEMEINTSLPHDFAPYQPFVFIFFYLPYN